MSRISSFIPQIKAANEALLSVNDDDRETSLLRMDANLDLDHHEARNHDDDDDDDSQSDSDHEKEENHAPMIELKLAVGDVNENPAIRMLADDDDDDDDHDERSKNSGGDDKNAKGEDDSRLRPDNNPPRAETAVLNLLKRRSGETLPSQPDLKRTLITELDKDDDEKQNAS